jgi:hypothetical protein
VSAVENSNQHGKSSINQEKFKPLPLWYRSIFKTIVPFFSFFVKTK